MTELLAYYKLCPITSDILGIAEDADKNAIICTLGKKIVYILQVRKFESSELHKLSIFIVARLSEATKILEHL